MTLQVLHLTVQSALQAHIGQVQNTVPSENKTNRGHTHTQKLFAFQAALQRKQSRFWIVLDISNLICASLSKFKLKLMRQTTGMDLSINKLMSFLYIMGGSLKYSCMEMYLIECLLGVDYRIALCFSPSNLTLKYYTVKLASDSKCSVCSSSQFFHLFKVNAYYLLSCGWDYMPLCVCTCSSTAGTDFNEPQAIYLWSTSPVLQFWFSIWVTLYFYACLIYRRPVAFAHPRFPRILNEMLCSTLSLFNLCVWTLGEVMLAHIQSRVFSIGKRVCMCSLTQ